MAGSTVASRDAALAVTTIGNNSTLDDVAGNLENMCQQLRLMVERLRTEHQQADDLQEEKRALEQHISGLQSRVSDVRDNSSHAQAEVNRLRDENNTLAEQLEDARNTIKILHQKKEAAEDYVERLAGLLESRPTKRSFQNYSADSNHFLKHMRESPLSSAGSSAKFNSSTGTDDETYGGEYTSQSTPLLLDGDGTSLTEEMPPRTESGRDHPTDGELRVRSRNNGRDGSPRPYDSTSGRTHTNTSVGDRITSNVAAAASSWRRTTSLERRLVCHRCFGQGLSCDNNTVCGHCEAAHTECTRSLCTDYWRKGGCSWKRCLRVHDEQGYNTIKVPLEKIQHGRGGGGVAPPTSHRSK